MKKEKGGSPASIEWLRSLSLLVLVAGITPLASGEQGPMQYALHLVAAAPLWLGIDLQWTRDRKLFWRFYVYLSAAVLLLAWQLNVPLNLVIYMLILFCLIFEYYGEKRPGASTRIIILLAFLIVISQFRHDGGLWMLGCLLLFLFTFFALLQTFYLSQQFGFSTKQALGRSWGGTSLHLLPIILMGFPLFLILPRLPQRGIFYSNNVAGNRITAFSENVNLNNISSLKESQEPILDLILKDNQLHSRYLKGRVLDRYKNGEWQPSNFYASPQFPGLVGGKKSFILNWVSPQDADRSIRYQIDQRPLYGNTLFFFNDTYRINGNFSFITNTVMKSHLHLGFSRAVAIKYEVETLPEGTLRETMMDPRVFLALPPNMGYLNRLADQVVGEHEQADAVVIEALLRYFRNNFRYSLQVNNVGATDPLADFLDKKQGHCELFASSMALLLRTKGIPSRLVTGFYLNEEHRTGDFFHVTAADAHAWVEAYYDGYWHTVDPTPPSPVPAFNLLEVSTARLSQYWRRYVLGYDIITQLEMIQDFGFWLKRKNISVPQFLLQVLGALTVLILLIWLGLRWLKARPNGADQLAVLFDQVDRRLQQRFYPRPGHKTLWQYLRALPAEQALREELSHFFKLYERLRFGGRPAANEIDNLRLQAGQLARRLEQKEERVNHVQH